MEVYQVDNRSSSMFTMDSVKYSPNG